MTEKILFEPGEYYIGDIGYALAEEFPTEFLNFENIVEGVHITKTEKKFWIAKMPTREGSIYDNKEGVWGFDFGCFGCMLYNEIVSKANYFMHKIEFKEPFEVKHENEIVYIGDMTFSFTPTDDFIKRTKEKK